jgi:hypothetical protein
MTTEGKRAELDDFAERIMKGVRKANYKLVIVSAANNDSLVIGDLTGKSKLVPAKEILAQLKAENSEEFQAVFEEISGSMKFCDGSYFIDPKPF